MLASPDDTVARLQERWSTATAHGHRAGRRARHPPAETFDDEVWRLTPGFHFPLERLHHLVWSDALDVRDGDGDTSRHGEEAPVDGGPLRPDGAVPLVNAEHGSSRALRRTTSTAELAPDQLEAVHHEGGPARIIAPAGSGKTRALTERAGLLLSGWGVAPEALCLVAFNRRAADEMRERTTDLPGLRVRTLNSLGLAVVNGTGEFAGTRDGARREVIDEPEVRRIVADLVDLPRRANTDPVAPWIEALGQVRLGLRSPESVETDYGGDLDGFGGFFRRYRERLADRNVLDFDEQIYAAVETLCRDPVSRHRAQRACRVLLVDEFQDLTPAHLLLVRLLAAPRYDVYGVGDDDQTIYGYNGADPSCAHRLRRPLPRGVHPRPRGQLPVPARDRRARRHPPDPQPATGREGHPGEAGTTRRARRLRVPRDRRPHRRHPGRDRSPPRTRRRRPRHRRPHEGERLPRAGAGRPRHRRHPPQRPHRTRVPPAHRRPRRAGVVAGPRRLPSARSRRRARDRRRPSRGLSPRVVDWMSEQRSLDDMGRLAGRLRDRELGRRSPPGSATCPPWCAAPGRPRPTSSSGGSATTSDSPAPPTPSTGHGARSTARATATTSTPSSSSGASNQIRSRSATGFAAASTVRPATATGSSSRRSTA
ncbi:MAG: UvrD-helicase domain-containing protein [Acidimicrobiia bacterium]|nr:UvrD-helicase domain-containing protein [Acidimicrobiia bacterium]